MSGSGRDRAVAAGYSAAGALLVTAPLLAPGYLLLRDAVSTPRSYPTDSALGLGDAAPRAVPQDALLAVLSAFVDGGLLVKAILVVALWAAGYGAAMLARDLLRVSLGPQLVAATVALWNPYVAERLLQGHWSLLAGYAALPWTALAAYRLRSSATAKRRRRILANALVQPGNGLVGPAAPQEAERAENAPPIDTTQHDRQAGPTGRAETPLATPGASEPPDGAASADTSEHLGGSTSANTPEHPHGATPADTPGTGQADQPRVTAPTDTPGKHQADQTRITAPTDIPGKDQVDQPLATATRRRSIRTVSAWAALAGSLAAAGLTPTGALLAGVTAFALVHRRQLLPALVLWVAASAPWLAATTLSGAGAEPSDPAGIAAFAARAEPGLGTLGSVAGLGGIWNAEAVPDSRTTPLAAIATLALLVIVALGVRAVATGGADPDNRHVRRALLLLAAIAVLFPALGATVWGMHALEWLVAHVPGAGLLRDTQKYVALAVPAYALCAAAGCTVTARRLSSAPTDRPTTAHPAATSMLAAVFVALLVLPLYDLAWGAGGAVRAVHYPAGWQRVAERIDGPGDVAVLPGGMFRKFRYSGPAPVLDPAPRMLPNDVLQTGELPVRGRTVSGEGARAGEVEALLLQGGSAPDLARLGVGWVLVERTTPGPLGASATTLAQLERSYEDADLALYRVPGVVEPRGSTTAQRSVIATAHLLWGALLVASPLAVLGIRARSRTRTRR
ncbi:hypothetical protein [Nocardia abscessus]|uniref:hypothetical protein n=1 Tax=Nocardia abscessus TaxID=120957 RepID=UPI0024546264|nr:hypothetical protein [Nocardia abscessus]